MFFFCQTPESEFSSHRGHFFICWIWAHNRPISFFETQWCNTLWTLSLYGSSSSGRRNQNQNQNQKRACDHLVIQHMENTCVRSRAGTTDVMVNLLHIDANTHDVMAGRCCDWLRVTWWSLLGLLPHLENFTWNYFKVLTHKNVNHKSP